ncbi:hypothetical protein NDU88_006968 [Pleurodeles waltl]|uniref:Uncharacterized protein n=1 Tax=Pleurodeles waltl TaxID=8319 RepID=A0AAV7N5N9_PLEWA|nr:hypothetical protein NDU88_006968 [Pleurodeles waltl]
MEPSARLWRPPSPGGTGLYGTPFQTLSSLQAMLLDYNGSASSQHRKNWRSRLTPRLGGAALSARGSLLSKWWTAGDRGGAGGLGRRGVWPGRRPPGNRTGDVGAVQLEGRCGRSRCLVRLMWELARKHWEAVNRGAEAWQSGELREAALGGGLGVPIHQGRGPTPTLAGMTHIEAKEEAYSPGALKGSWMKKSDLGGS